MMWIEKIKAKVVFYIVKLIFSEIIRLNKEKTKRRLTIAERAELNSKSREYKNYLNKWKNK